MLLKKDLRAPNEKLRFKRRVVRATLIQTTIYPDSFVARSVFVAEFFNSIGHKPTSSPTPGLGCFRPVSGPRSSMSRSAAFDHPKQSSNTTWASISDAYRTLVPYWLRSARPSASNEFQQLTK
jgi:hypothetical protein